MLSQRKKTKKIRIGNVYIGGNAPILVQSMSTFSPSDFENIQKEIKLLEEAGCELVRVAIPDRESALNLKKLRKGIKIPLIADIHFDYRLAILAIEQGVDKIRINPGNIKNEEHLKKIIKTAKERDIAIRIGINGGSMPLDIVDKYQGVTPEGMVDAALRYVDFFEANDFGKIVISIKASDVETTVRANRLLSSRVSYPIHLGITEAGPYFEGSIKSAIGIGILLAEGIGDTIRVSLTADPVKEIEVAFNILKFLNIRRKGPEIVSCPTCGRSEINVKELVEKIWPKIKNIDLPIKVAVMGCPVNGPGEARDADIGIAGTKDGYAIIFRKGKILERVKMEHLMDKFLKYLEEMK